MGLDDVIARESIRHTINSYTVTADCRDAEGFVALWAEDAIFEFAGFPPLPGFRNEGIEDFRRMVSSWSSTPGADPSRRRTSFVRHNLTTCRINLTGPDSARARTYFIVHTDIGPDHSGFYDDELVRQRERWLFAHRQVALDWRSPNSLFPPLER
jgi:SnoaL-like protein